MSATPGLDELCEVLRTAAREELEPRFANVERHIKRDRSLVTEADRAMQERVQAELQRRWPAFPLLGEEMSAQEQAALLAEPHEGLWVLDPLDGTTNFAAGLPFYSTSLALVQQGQARLGVVYDPSRDECFSAARGRGARLNGRPLEGPPDLPAMGQAIGAVDFKRLKGELPLRLAAGPPYASQRSFGSVALDWCWLACRRFHLYLHGGQRLWDYAAGLLVLEEAGGHACTLQGGPVFRLDARPRSALAAPEYRLYLEWREWLIGP